MLLSLLLVVSPFEGLFLTVSWYQPNLANTINDTKSGSLVACLGDEGDILVGPNT